MSMVLLDTNVLIYAGENVAALGKWAFGVIAGAAAGEGVAVNAIAVAEYCVGDKTPGTVADRLRGWGVSIVDVPAAASVICAAAYREYRERRKACSGRGAPSVPLADFFIGAHAQLMGWTLATADAGRFRTYFPRVRLLTPSDD